MTVAVTVDAGSVIAFCGNAGMVTVSRIVATARWSAAGTRAEDFDLASTTAVITTATTRTTAVPINASLWLDTGRSSPLPCVHCVRVDHLFITRRDQLDPSS
ncbi:hypothetical protein GCM10029964_072630 [Kibdelosporangium lantanae]